MDEQVFIILAGNKTNFYAGSSFASSHALAQSAFSSQLSYAYGVDYTNLYAVNSIAGISSEMAHAFIAYGVAMAIFRLILDATDLSKLLK